MKQIRIFIQILLVTMIPACTDTGKPSTPAMGSVTEGRNSDIADNQSLFNSANYGHYVSDGYLNRDQGYDWVSVYVKERSPYQVAISVRSRIDRKKPTCTFDGVASIIDQNTLMINSDFSMQFTFESDSLSIQGKTEEDNNRMYFYCSGGATLAGKYIMIDGPPDPDQVDQRAYFSTLNWNDLFFQVVATNEMITVTPQGLEIVNSPESREIDGEVILSEIGDLNLDGSPEILIYLASTDSSHYGTMIGYSVNNGKSMSQVYLPPISDDPELSQGYMGHDEFAIVENSLVRRFPLYKVQDSGAEPTNSIRQIQYKLVDGEAGRRFEADKVVEY